jgi:hypothetical protein
MTKSLQVKNQVLRGSVNLHFLEGVLVLLALRAVPLVVASENLFLAKEAQTVLDRDAVPTTPKPLCLQLARGATEINLFEVWGL